MESQLLLFISDNFILNTGDFKEALNYFTKAYQISFEINNIQGRASTLTNMAIIHERLADHPKAIDCLLKAIQIYEKGDNKVALANAYSNLGIIYLFLNQTSTAIKYSEKGLKVFEAIDSKQNMAISYINIAEMYRNIGVNDKSLVLNLKALEILTLLNDSTNMAVIFSNLADTYLRMNQINKAKLYVNQAIEINSKSNQYPLLVNDLLIAANIEFKQKNYTKSYDMAKDAYTKAHTIQQKDSEIKILKFLAEVAQVLNYKDEAVNYITAYAALKDTVLNDENNKKIIAAEVAFENHLNTEKDSIENAVIHAHKDKEITKQKQLVIKKETKSKLLSTGLSFALIILLASVFKINSTLKSKNEVVLQSEEKEKINTALVIQKNIIEHSKDEIIKSIKDAKRLQEAILLEDKIVKQYLEESFILYMPKDIVAGDFYWMHTQDDWVWFAACDCTGHGVPGAMLTLVCHEALNKAVKEMKAQNPAQALDYASLLIEEHFNKEGNPISIADGMDASLCLLNTKTNELFWAGANNPLWVFRKNNLLEYKADKQPVGKYEFRKNFSLHKINLEINDAIYIFSDGFADQFGGLMGKKMMKKRFEASLLSLQAHHMEEQKRALITYFQNWKQELDQVDDVLVMGYRL
jgi:tetratricopeptide (TPR) repeat protein